MLLCLVVLCFHAVDRETDVTESSQVAAAASQIDEDVIERETFFVSLAQMIYHFLAKAIDIENSCLIDELTARDILLPSEEQKIKKQKKTEAKVRRLLMMLRRKSAAQFKSFLTTLSETGQQSVADVVLQALHTVSRTDHNLLHYARGMTTTCLEAAKNRNIAFYGVKIAIFRLSVARRTEFSLSGRRGPSLPDVPFNTVTHCPAKHAAHFLSV